MTVRTKYLLFNSLIIESLDFKLMSLKNKRAGFLMFPFVSIINVEFCNKNF